MRNYVIVAVLVGLAVAMPFDVAEQKVQPKQRDNCGAITLPLLDQKLNQLRMIRGKQGKANSVNCEICLDLVDIAKTYEECGEAYVEHKLEAKCDEDFEKQPEADKACRGIVDEIAHDVIDDTEHQDAPSMCTKWLKQVCKYD
ncbi:unnamed protein product, partial [Mesorhabditis spiculigera]